MLEIFSQVHIVRDLSEEDENEQDQNKQDIFHIARLVIFRIIAGINSVHYPEEKTAFTVQPDPVCKSDWSFVPCCVKKSLCYMNCHCGISSR